MADFAIQAQAQDINFIAKFESDLHNLLAILNKTDVEVMAPGTAFKTYKSSGSLPSADVEEKGLISDADYGMGDAVIAELTYKKYRNLVGIESIGKKGYEVAVGGANNALLRDVQKGIRSTIYAAIATGTGSAGTGTDLQSAIAKAAALVSKKFEDEASTPVFFVSPDDAFDYLGSHNVTVEQNFGLSYLSNFMGLGNVIIDSNVASGSVFGTATENLAVVAASIASIPGMEMTTDESGIIAVHNGARYENAALETVAYCGLSVLPVYADRIAKATIKATT